MEFDIVGFFTNFNLIEREDNINLNNGLFLSGNKKYLLEKTFNDGFIQSIGTIKFQSSIKLNYVFGHFNIEQIDSDFLLREVLERYANYVQGILLSLWFVKDNSVNLPELYLHNSNAKMVLTNTKYNLFSDSRGDYNDCEFSAREILEAMRWLEMSSQFLALDNGEFNYSENDSIVDYKVNNNNKKLPYDQFGRISRALTFLQYARKESFLPLKITGYVGVLETIFSTDNNEVAHQISERVALFLDGDSKNKFENYKFLKRVYGMRSDYVHGAKFSSKKYSEMESACSTLDELVRQIMKKVLVEYSYFNDASNNEMTSIFLNMIFEKADD